MFTRVGLREQLHPIHKTSCTVNWKNVTEAIIESVQHRGNATENLL